MVHHRLQRPAMEHLACFLLFLTSFTTVSIGQDQFIYNGFSGSNLILDGTAMVTPNGILELTNGASTYETSYALYPTPWQFLKVPLQSFSVNFVLFMAPSIRCPDSMAFMIFPSKGLKNDQRESNLAVNFLSCQDKRFLENNENDISISINSSFSRPLETHPAGFYDDKNGIFNDLPLVGGKAVQIWVDYDGEATQMNVTIAPLKLTKPLRPTLSAILNISTILDEGVSYIGFSSGANNVGALNYVLGWSFGMNSPAPTIDIIKLPKLPRFGPKVRSKTLKIVLPIVITTVILLVGAAVTALVWRRKRYAELYEDWEVEFGPYRFSYKYLFDATEGFNNEKILGVGGFGKVYKGVLPDSKLEVAIKRVSHESKQGIKEFIAEIVSIGRIRHRNLVQLLGYCRRKDELLLVYDYMPNGSLDKYLHCKEGKYTLDWAKRFQIIRGVASGLFYLHEKWEKVVIHRDIKASNVLLDAEMNGHLGDFGLARLYEHGNDPQTTHVAGTFGYIAPEMARTGKASPLTDVYAFAIFVLEVTCGRRPINNYTHDSPTILVDWVVEHWQKGSLTSTLDVRLQGDHNADEVNLVLKLGLLCANPICTRRPGMRQVMQYLDNEMPLPRLMPTNLSYSMLGYLQNDGFDQYKSVPSTVCSNNLTSSLTSGR
nr:L-type lectin-domain containing receptor kinase IV.1-like [Oryza sativa Japonica Group]